MLTFLQRLNGTRGALLIGLMMLPIAELSAQSSIFSNPITGTNPHNSNPYTAGQSFDPSITVSGIGRGPGITAITVSATDRYAAKDFTTNTAMDLNDYFIFTLTPNAGSYISLDAFDYTGQSSGTGPLAFALRSSVDGYTNNIGSPTANGTTINLRENQFQNITSAITFRLYAYDAGSSGGSFSVNSFTFSGVVTTVPLPINLISFSVKSNGTTDLLTWSTTCNSTARSFIVERSGGTDRFSPLATVIAKEGSCNGDRNYSSEVPSDRTAQSLYRLSMQDQSGETTYSQTLVLRNSKQGNGNIVVLPNPATNTISIDGAETGSHWQMCNAQGRIVKAGNLTGSEICIQELPPGMYFLRCEGLRPACFTKH